MLLAKATDLMLSIANAIACGSRRSAPADEEAGEEEDSGVGESHCVHAARGGDGEELIDEKGAGEGHEHAELRRHDAPRVGERLGQHVSCAHASAGVKSA
jgi:hypothetical protein